MNTCRRALMLILVVVVFGLLNVAVPSGAAAQTPGPKMSVFELVTSPT